MPEDRYDDDDDDGDDDDGGGDNGDGGDDDNDVDDDHENPSYFAEIAGSRRVFLVPNVLSSLAQTTGLRCTLQD